MRTRRWPALLATAAIGFFGLAAVPPNATAAPRATAQATPVPPRLPSEMAQPPELPPLAGLPGTGRLVGFSAADLASNAAVPVMVQLTPKPAADAELADRRAGRPKWDVAKRRAAEAAVAAQQDAIVQRIATAGVPATVTRVDLLAASGRRVTTDRRLTYAASAVGMTMPGTMLPALAGQAGVVAVFDDRPTQQIQLDHSVPYVQAPQVWHAPTSGGTFAGNDGSGELIAVIDSGVDWTHPMFGGSSATPPGPGDGCQANPSACSGDNTKVVYAAAASDAGSSPQDNDGHGTHVASIAAGDSVTAPIGTISGVAPGAKLMSYKVTNAAGMASDSDTEMAMEDAIQPSADHAQADVVNLSLGGQTADNSVAQLESVIADIGMLVGSVVTIASGNLGPGRATVSAPATAQLPIVVGASDDPGNAATGTAGGTTSPMVVVPTTGPNATNGIHQSITANYVDCGGANTPVDCGSSASGKIALVFEGESSAPNDDTRVTNASSNGEVAVVLVRAKASGETGDEPFSGSVSNPPVPVLGATANEGAALRALGVDSTTHVSTSTLKLDVPAAAAFTDDMAAFSSQGPLDEYTIKPDVTAPGQRIYAARSSVCAPTTCGSGYSDPNGPYLSLSGTSTAAPHVAGAAALVLAGHPGWDPFLVKDMLSNTGRLMPPSTTSVNQQGGGAIQAFDAARTPVLLDPPQLSFGEIGTAADSARVVWRAFFVANFGATPVTYNLSIRHGLNYPTAGFDVSFRQPADPKTPTTSIAVPAFSFGQGLLRVLVDGTKLAQNASAGSKCDASSTSDQAACEGIEFVLDATPTGASAGLPALHVPGFYRHTNSGPPPRFETPGLQPLGLGNGSGSIPLEWSPVSDGAVGYQVQDATQFTPPVPTDTAEGRTKPSDDAALWSSDGGWTASTSRNHTAGGTTSYTAGDGPSQQNTLSTKSFPSLDRIAYWEAIDADPQHAALAVVAVTPNGPEIVRVSSGPMSSDFTHVTVDLPDGTTSVQFLYVTDGSNDPSGTAHAGAFIDDITVSSGNYADAAPETADTTTTITGAAPAEHALRVVAVRLGVNDQPQPGPAGNTQRQIVADAGGPYTAPYLSPTVTLQGAPATATDHTFSLVWDFGDGAVGEGPTPAHLYTTPGSLTATLSVVDEDGLAATDTAAVDVQAPVPPPPVQAGYWLAASDGGIFSFGVPFFGSTGALTLNKPIVGMAATPSGLGYWLVASDGGIFAFGDAQFYGSTGALKLKAPIVGMAATPSGQGYWLVASDGGIFAFGDAQFYGSTGALKLNKPIVGMAATPSGQGYWLVASDGGIFAFGDAPFLGSTGAIALNKPIVGMASTGTGTGQGYWLVASDGGIFAFGDAPFLGSTGAVALNKPILGMTPYLGTAGYWLVASDGGIFAFGRAPFLGSTGAMTLNRPIVGIAGLVNVSP